LKRKIHLHIMLSDDEDRKLHNMMCETGFTASQLIRSLITQTEIKTRPPSAMPQLLRELSAIGNNVNQIAKVANYSDKVYKEDLQEMKQAFDKLSKEVRKL